MRFLWFDAETTGLDPCDSAPFQLAFILVDNGKVVNENVFSSTL